MTLNKLLQVMCWETRNTILCKTPKPPFSSSYINRHDDSRKRVKINVNTVLEVKNEVSINLCNQKWKYSEVCTVLTSLKVNAWNENFYSSTQPEPFQMSFLSFGIAQPFLPVSLP